MQSGSVLVYTEFEIAPVFWKSSLMNVKLDGVGSDDVRCSCLSWSIFLVFLLIGMLLVRVTSMGVNVDSTLVWLSHS